MDLNNGKCLSPWKVPSKISLKRIQHKINSDLNNSNVSTTNFEKNSTKTNGKRNRLMINKFALARAISLETSDENVNSSTDKSSKDDDQHLLAKLQQIASATNSTINSSEPSNYHSTIKHFSFEQTFSSNDSSNKISTNEIIDQYPIDWSLKSFCRFSTSKSSSLISQLTKLRSTDESQALDYICSSTNIENNKAYFRSLTSYWSYPHLSWLKLYPRSQQICQSNGISLDEQSQQSIQDEWKISFQSLFQSFRTKYSPFFYLCTHTFNILFREDEQYQFIVIISPTTTGFRSTLEKEGIEFSMADGGDILNNSTTKIVNEEQGERNDDDEDNEDDEEINEKETCEQWLEDIGLSATTSTSTTTTSSSSNLTKKKSSKIINEKSRSTTILIRDISSMNSLFNFLLNKSQRVCIPLSGPLTGIPPTLISPRPFLNSTLKYLNVQIQSNQMLTIDGGPILPDRLKNLWKLFQENHSDLQMNSIHFERTSMFNYQSEQHRTIKQIEKTNQNQILLQSFSI